MSKIKNFLPICWLLIFLLPQASVGQNAYWGLSLSNIQVKANDVRRSILPHGPTVFSAGCAETDTTPACIRPSEFFDLNERLKQFQIKLGYRFYNALSVELRAGFGVGESNLDIYGEEREANIGFIPQLGSVAKTFTTPIDSTMGLAYSSGAYLKIEPNHDFSIWRHLSPYVNLGFQTVKFDTGLSGGTASMKSEAANYILGFSIRPFKEKPFEINIEKGSMKSTNGNGGPTDLRVNSTSIGFNYKF